MLNHPLPQVVLTAQIVLYKSNKHLYFAFSEHVAERYHTVAAVGNVAENLFVGGVFVFAVADVWDDATVVERFAHRFGAVADGTVLAEEGSFVCFAVGDRVARWFLVRTGKHKS